MLAFLTTFFGDEKHQAGFISGLAIFLTQFAASKGLLIDQHTADAVSGGIVALGAFVIGGHAHVQHAEAHADGAVEVARINSTSPVGLAVAAAAATAKA